MIAHICVTKGNWSIASNIKIALRKLNSWNTTRFLTITPSTAASIYVINTRCLQGLVNMSSKISPSFLKTEASFYSHWFCWEYRTVYAEVIKLMNLSPPLYMWGGRERSSPASSVCRQNKCAGWKINTFSPEWSFLKQRIQNIWKHLFFSSN